MVSALPANALGRACAGELRRHGVDTSGIRFADGRMGLYFLAPGAMQRPAEVTYDRADSVFAQTPAPAYRRGRNCWPARAGCICPASTWRSSDNGAQATLAAVRAARDAGVAVSFDCNYRGTTVGRAWRAGAATALRSARRGRSGVRQRTRHRARSWATEFAGSDASSAFCVAARLRLHELSAPARAGDHRAPASSMSTRWICTACWPRAPTCSPRRHTASPASSIASAAGDAFAAGLLHGLITGTARAGGAGFRGGGGVPEAFGSRRREPARRRRHARPSSRRTAST